MIPKYLYHYTEIKTLKLILENNSIRFKRFDKLNDPYEGIFKINDIKNESIRKSLFCSCWCEEENENLALWYMYTKAKGVRIKLKSNMFGDFSNIKEFSNGFCFITKINEIYFLNDIKANKVYGPVKIKYISSEKDLFKAGTSRSKANEGTDNEFEMNDIDIISLSSKKIAYWKHENEWRYIITPFIEIHGSDHAMNCVEDNQCVQFTDKEYIDIKLTGCIEEVLVGPDVSDDEFRDLEDYLKKMSIPIRRSVIKVNIK